LLPDGGTMAGMSYAVAYPLGILGIIATMGIVRVCFRISVEKEISDYNHSLGGQRNKLQSVEITISNANVFGKKICDIQELLDGELAVSRIYRNEAYILATDNETLQEGDVLYGVSAQQYLEDLRLKLGEVAITGSKEITGQMSIKNILLTNRRLAGKTIEQVGIYRRYPANITRIFRNGMEILPTRSSTIELGDTLKVVGEKAALTEIKNELGDSVKELAIPHIVPIFLGIFLGIILGSISIYIPGLPAPAKLGLAGGPLLIAILLGYKGRIGKMSFYMTPGANLMLRELGIIHFLACVGLLSGDKFVETIANGGWVWIIYGVIITLVPIIVVGFVARFFFKVNYLKICGFIAGSMTDPPALEFANGIAPAQAQSTAYATVYPLTMFMRILLAQLLILIAM
ncbi:MAG: transporter, partial [Prevotellaceae bacterium]|nr:transporter [Prevotellaceae bacterium]